MIGVFPKTYFIRKLKRFLLTSIMSSILSSRTACRYF